MSHDLSMLGQMYRGLDHLYEVVDVGAVRNQYCVQALGDPGLRAWVSGAELARMERLVPEAVAELEALWASPVAGVAPVLVGLRPSAATAQINQTGAGDGLR